MPHKTESKPRAPAPSSELSAAPCSADQMVEIVANLRTLATMDSSLDRTRPPYTDLWPTTTPVRKLVASTEESLRHINGILHWGQDTADLPIDAQPRSLTKSEIPFAAVMQAALSLLLEMRLGVTPTDCGAQLLRLADQLETTFTGLFPCEAEKIRVWPANDGAARPAPVAMNPNEWVRPRDIAERHGVPYEPLRVRLVRLRQKLKSPDRRGEYFDSFMEIPDRNSNEAQYMVRYRVVRPMIEALQEKMKSSR